MTFVIGRMAINLLVVGVGELESCGRVGGHTFVVISFCLGNCHCGKVLLGIGEEERVHS